MTLQTLRYFSTLVELGSFTKAAKECFVTQPALSRAIGELEKELGRPLLIRTAKRVWPTHAGKVCYEEAKKVLKQCEILVERVRMDEDDSIGEIRIGYLFNGNLAYLADIIQKFHTLYPNVVLKTEYKDYNDAYRMLKNG